jgi:hypothetical protein
VSPLADGRHGRGVEHVVLSGATEVIRHPARRRRVHGHVIIVIVVVVVATSESESADRKYESEDQKQ